MFTFFRQQLHWGTSLTRAPAGNASWDVRWSRRSVSSSTASPQTETSCSTSPGYSGQKQSIWHSVFRYQCYDHSFSSSVRKIRNQWIFKINPIELKPTIPEFIVLALLLSTVLWKKPIKNIPVNVSTLPRTLMLKRVLIFTARWPYTRTAARPWLTTPPPTGPLSASSRNISTSRSVYYTQTCVCSFK